MESITQLIYEGVALNKNDKEKSIGTYYPSEIWSCSRRIYFSYLYPEHDSKSFDFLKIMAIGSAFHLAIQKALISYGKKHKGTIVRNEPEDVQRIYKVADIELHGRMDCMIETKKGMTILEIKSHGNFNYLKEAQHSHIMQLNYYLHFYPKAEGILLYVNKSKGEPFREFKLKYKEELFRELVQRALDIHSSITSNKPPKAEAYLHSDSNRGGTNDYECVSCPIYYKTKCYKELMTRKDISDKELLALEKAI